MKSYATQSEIATAARGYIARGWRVFPCYSVHADGTCRCARGADCASPGKHPVGALVPHGVKDASADATVIAGWFAAAEDYNVAIATGSGSGLTVVDVDAGEGKVGGETWAALIATHGEPPTLMARTGGGGMHVLFAYTPRLKTGSDRLGRHVDVKNDGGYIIAAPSRHTSGGVYEWLNWGTPVAAMPAHFIPTETRGRPRKEDPVHRPHTLEDVQGMLDVIPADERTDWLNVGVILGREFQRSDEAWAMYGAWAEKWTGHKKNDHDKTMHTAFYVTSQHDATRMLSMGTIVRLALAHGWVPPRGGTVPLDRFLFDCNNNNYIYLPTGNAWDAGTVDALVSMVNDAGTLCKPSVWVKCHANITSTVCDPDVEGDVRHGWSCPRESAELVRDPYGAVYNTYRHPTIPLGDATKAGPFVAHCRRVFCKPGDADQYFNYMAHLRQHPGVKMRFALLISGEQGTGKDTAIELCCAALGYANVRNIEPQDLDSPYDTYYTATLVRISETANQPHMSKWAFTQRTKVLIAGQPDYKGINPKYGRQYFVRLHGGVIITTNHLTDGIYIPNDDRRFDVLACATKAEMGLADDTVRMAYFDDLYAWLHDTGATHVAAWLQARDLTGFTPSSQRKTEAHHAATQGGMSGDEWCGDALARCTNKSVVSGTHLCQLAVQAGERPADVKQRLGYAMDRQGYVNHRNPDSKDGRWWIKGANHRIYILPSFTNKPRWDETLDGYPFVPKF